MRRLRVLGCCLGLLVLAACTDVPNAGPPKTNYKAVRLVASNGQANDYFGGDYWYDAFHKPVAPIYYASPGETAMSANGDYAVVGAPGRNNGQGAAYVFARSGATWAQEAMLTLAQPHPYEGFGWAVAMSSDGSTILVSAPFHSSRGLTGNGGAWVFHRTGTQWTQLAELEPSDAAKFDAFGWSFAIAGEQAPYTVFVGAPSHIAAGVAQGGAVYVFSGSRASWTFRSELHAAKPVVNGGYGTGVALSQDAATGVVTTFDHTDPKKVHHQGAVAIYTTADGWSHSTLAASFPDPNRNLDKTPDAYGTDAGISADGTTVMVAAPDVFVGGIGGAGALYVYAVDSPWKPGITVHTDTLTQPTPVAFGYYGSSVDVDQYGTSAVVGADGIGTDGQGGLFRIIRPPGKTHHWPQGSVKQSLLPAQSDVTGVARLGTDVAMSHDGLTMIGSAPYATVATHPHQGLAYVFTVKP